MSRNSFTFLGNVLTFSRSDTALAQLRPVNHQPDASLGDPEYPRSLRDLRYVGASNGANRIVSVTVYCYFGLDESPLAKASCYVARE